MDKYWGYYCGKLKIGLFAACLVAIGLWAYKLYVVDPKAAMVEAEAKARLEEAKRQAEEARREELFAQWKAERKEKLKGIFEKNAGREDPGFDDCQQAKLIEAMMAEQPNRAVYRLTFTTDGMACCLDVDMVELVIKRSCEKTSESAKVEQWEDSTGWRVRNAALGSTFENDIMNWAPEAKKDKEKRKLSPGGRTIYTLHGGYPACTTRELFKKAIELYTSGDSSAFHKFIVTSGGACGVTKTGAEVFLEDISMFSGVVAVRPVGDTTTVFTNYEAVK